MVQSVRAVFRSVSWDEQPIHEESRPKLTRAHCRQAYTGDIEGESTLEYLMVYHENGDATFVGVERISGSVAGRKGTFALRHVGEFSGGVARMTLTVVEGAGTSELQSLRGSGEFSSPHASEYEVVLDCSFGP